MFLHYSDQISIRENESSESSMYVTYRKTPANQLRFSWKFNRDDLDSLNHWQTDRFHILYIFHFFNLTHIHIKIPHLEPGVVQKAPYAYWTSSDLHCGGQSLHWGFGPAGLGAGHLEGSSSDQKYCKPSCPEEYRQSTLSAA